MTEVVLFAAKCWPGIARSCCDSWGLIGACEALANGFIVCAMKKISVLLILFGLFGLERLSASELNVSIYSPSDNASVPVGTSVALTASAFSQGAAVT